MFEALTAALAKMTSLQQLNLQSNLCPTSCVSVYVGWSESPHRAARDQSAGQLHSVVLTPPRLLACLCVAVFVCLSLSRFVLVVCLSVYVRECVYAQVNMSLCVCLSACVCCAGGQRVKCHPSSPG